MSERPTNEFEKAGEQDQPSFAQELLQMLKHNKKFWLLPLIIAFIVFGLLLALGGSAAAPFIYTLF